MWKLLCLVPCIYLVSCASSAPVKIGADTYYSWPFVVSCGNQRSQSRMVVAGRVGMWASRWGGLSTCPCGLMALELETVP